RAEREAEMAGRAQDLARKGRDAEAPLPGEIVQGLEEAARLMSEAARQLAEGNAEWASALEQDAQRQLERSRTGRAQEGQGDPSNELQRGHGGERDAYARAGVRPGAR